MKRRQFLYAGGAAVATLAAGAPARAQFAKQLTIAVNVPLSGEFAREGEQITNGIRGAIDEFNLSSGPLGIVFGLRTFDDQGALAIAISNVQFAASDPTIIAMIGNLQGSLTTATLSEY